MLRTGCVHHTQNILGPTNPANSTTTHCSMAGGCCHPAAGTPDVCMHVPHHRVHKRRVLHGERPLWWSGRSGRRPGRSGGRSRRSGRPRRRRRHRLLHGQAAGRPARGTTLPLGLHGHRQAAPAPPVLTGAAPAAAGPASRGHSRLPQTHSSSDDPALQRWTMPVTVSRNTTPPSRHYAIAFMSPRSFNATTMFASANTLFASRYLVSRHCASPVRHYASVSRLNTNDWTVSHRASTTADDITDSARSVRRITG